MRETVPIVLGGAEHQLRPTWEAYGEIEARCGPLPALYRSVGFGSATLKDLAVIVAAGMKAAGSADGRPVDETAVSKRLYEAGVWDEDAVILPIVRYLESLGWTPEQRKKREAKAQEMLDEPSSDPLNISSPSPQPNTV